jgi:hypothetical protein
MTPQTTFMVAATILPERRDELEALLASMNSAPGIANPFNTVVPWHQLSQLHVARFTILEANTNDDIRKHGVDPMPWPATLVFIGDIDGDRQQFLAELCLRAEQGLIRIFRCCAGFDASRLLPWLNQQQVSPTANYINWRGRTVEQIHEELALVRFIREQLPECEGLPLEQLHRMLRQRVEEQTAALQLRLSEDKPTPAPWWVLNFLHLLLVPLIGLILLPVLLVAAPFFLIYLRRLETNDPENTSRAPPQHLQQLIETEDLDVTNHFNVFGQVKPGLFRRITICVLLLLLDYAARHIYRRGYLTRIQTIHFARWVLMDRGRRVYFASNYDGSADSYMDDFINKVAWGLNLVFSNGVGYPRTRFLIKGGAEHEEKYKYTLRRNQLASSSWYKAYSGLTAVDLARNHRIRRGLEMASPSQRELKAWASLL